MDISLNINNIETNFWIEFFKLWLPPLVTGVIALIPFLYEKKTAKEKYILEQKLSDLKLLKSSLQNYYHIVNAYRFSCQKNRRTKI